MSCAYLATLQSLCLQRFVGAALFNGEERLNAGEGEVEIKSSLNLLSIGFNAPPKSIKPCTKECHRKELQGETSIKCPKCKKNVGTASVCLYCGKIIAYKKKHPSVV